MRLDTRKLAFAAALAWAGWYTICAFFVAVAPVRFEAILSYVFHYSLTGSRPITWGAYFIGMIGTSVWVALFVATIGWCYNALSRDRSVGVFPERTAARAG